MSKRKEGTLAALLEEKRKRGRPKRAVSRKNVYVALSTAQKDQMRQLADTLPAGLRRSDLPDMAINLLAARLELLRRAVADRNREIPEGITDFDSLYLLWDLPLARDADAAKWTSIRLSPQQSVELGRAHGILNALFGATRSDVFGLSLALLAQFMQKEMTSKRYSSIEEVNDWITQIYL
ncbi:MAG TPA: hypothetical protein VLE70_18685 [Anaerolineae bacterium]|jgi:hypothetical protein|nr:hypothetical protein [Anaerolineae bacterium]